MLSEWMACLGGFLLVSVIGYYSLFGQPDSDKKYIKIFGVTNRILGNKSIVIPTKVIVALVTVVSFCFFIAAVLYSLGY